MTDTFVAFIGDLKKANPELNIWTRDLNSREIETFVGRYLAEQILGLETAESTKLVTELKGILNTSAINQGLTRAGVIPPRGEKVVTAVNELMNLKVG